MSNSILFPGILQRTIKTTRLHTGPLERAVDDPNAAPKRTVIFLQGRLPSALFWQRSMLELPKELRVIAIDLRGFGISESIPVDAARGVQDFSDDLASAMESLGLSTAHFVGGQWAEAS